MAAKTVKTAPVAEKKKPEATPERVDPTPLDNYTLAGVAAGKSTPESR
jgi:hypothetical protein